MSIFRRPSRASQALRNMHNLLCKGGKLILLVPAYPFLYGTGDEAVGHFRRYQKKPLSASLQKAGFEIEEQFFMHTTGILGWFLHSKLMRKREGAGEVALYDKLVVPFVARLEEVIRPRFGLSLVFIGVKQ